MQFNYSNKFVTGVKIKAKGELQINDSCCWTCYLTENNENMEFRTLYSSMTFTCNNITDPSDKNNFFHLLRNIDCNGNTKIHLKIQTKTHLRSEKKCERKITAGITGGIIMYTVWFITDMAGSCMYPQEGERTWTNVYFLTTLLAKCFGRF